MDFLIPNGLMEAGLVEDEFSGLRLLCYLVVVQQLEDSGSDGGRDTHDDGLWDALDGVRLPIVCCVEKVVGGFLKLEIIHHIVSAQEIRHFSPKTRHFSLQEC